MASFNRIIIVGYLGRDPELRYTPEGTPVCKFSVATTERRKDRAGESQEITTWFNVSVWGKRAEVVSQHLSKGSPIYLEGRLTQREWQDRDGKSKTALDVSATAVEFLGPVAKERPEDAGPRMTQRSLPVEEVPF
jgi:single-strand DNA-binding protein